MALQKLNPFSNVGANLTAVMPFISQGMTFERIMLKMGGTTFTEAHITAIRLTLGGKKIVEISGAHLKDINEYYKETAVTNYLNIWFADPNAQNMDDYLAGALDTSNQYSNFSMEVDIGAATAPTLEAWADLSAPIQKSAVYKNLFRTLIKTVHAPGAANEFSLPVAFGSAQGALIRGVHMFHTNVTKLQVKKDGFYLLEDAANALNQAYQNNYGRTTQAGLINWDPLVSNKSQFRLVPTLRGDGRQANIELKATVSAADTITAYSDLLQTHAGV